MSQPIAAFVYFTDKSELPWLRFLRRGFRHCEVALRGDDGSWIGAKGVLGSLELLPLGRDFDPIAFAEARQDCRIVPVADVGKRGGLVLFGSCVGFTKALLGIKAPFVFTPWQLFNYLQARM